MSKQIQELDALTVNQIAAGEVVERPLSVVKELVENAIDAGATAISVEIREGGVKLIRVTDNGSGIDKEQVRMAFRRHFTSKLRKIEDLYAIDSLGFRGEALAAIAGVSVSEIITKTEDALTGVRLVQEGVSETAFEEIGAPKGTTLLIKELFFNTPARKKFLKSEKTESAYVIEFMQRISLAYRQIAFKLIADGKVKLQTNGDGDLRAAILYIFGAETAKKLKEVRYLEKGVKISGFVGTPELNRGNRSYEIYFVNGRYVKSKWIQEGIEEGAFGYVMQHQFPFAVLEIGLEPDKLDVNVHPQKAEVRFENGYLVKEAVRRAVAQAFAEKEVIPAVTLDNKAAPRFQPDQAQKAAYNRAEPFETNRLKAEDKQPFFTAAAAGNKADFTQDMSGTPVFAAEKALLAEAEAERSRGKAAGFIRETEGSFGPEQPEKPLTAPVTSPGRPIASPEGGGQTSIAVPAAEQEFIDLTSVKSHKVIGQLFDTYWLIEFQGALYIIDQHAAHEKVLYERFVKRFNDSDIHTQQLLDPLVIEVSAREMQNFLAAQPFFARLGFETEPFGAGAIKISGVPYLFNQAMKKENFIYLLDQMEEKNFKLNAETIDHELATMACKAAVKGNDRLSRQEYEGLISELLTLKNPYHCPHGRPTLIKMTRYELDRKFKRIL